MKREDLVVETLCVSHSLQEFLKEGRPGIPGQSFQSYTFKRSDGKPMTLDEAALASSIMHIEVKNLLMIDAAARGVLGTDTVKQAMVAYKKGMEGVIHSMEEKLGLRGEVKPNPEVKKENVVEGVKYGNLQQKEEATRTTPQNITQAIVEVKSEVSNEKKFAMPQGASPTHSAEEAVYAWLEFHKIATAFDDTNKIVLQANAVTHLKALLAEMGKERYEAAKKLWKEGKYTQEKQPILKQEKTVEVRTGNDPIPVGVGETVSAESILKV